MSIRILTLIFSVSLALPVALAQNERQDPAVRAAIEMLESKNEIERNYRFCHARAGDYAYKFDYIKYVWELENRSFVQVSQNLFDGLPAAESTDIKKSWRIKTDQLLSDRSRAINNENGMYCSDFFSKITTGSIHKLTTAREILAPKLGTREQVRVLVRNTDFEIGCVKAGFNNDIKQFEVIKDACACQNSLLVKNMSNADIDEYIALLRRKPSDATEFVAKKVPMAELRACYFRLGTR